MLPKRNYYLNDYFDLFDKNHYKEKEYMKTDIYEKERQYIIETELPGIKKENIKISELSVDFKKSALLSDKQVNIKANFETNSADFTISNQDNTTDFARINMKF